MNITPPPQGPPSVFLSNYSDAGKIWKVGELLRAVAVKQTAQNQLTLQIGNQRYTAHAQAPVKTGVPLLLRVIRAGTQPVLEVIPEGTRAAQQAALASHQASAHQAPPPPLLSSLIKLTAKPGESQLPPSVARAVQRVLESLPQARQLVESGSLRRMMLDSGTFLESRLAKLPAEAAGSLDQDWKAALLRLRHSLRDLVPAKDLSGARGETGRPEANRNKPLSPLQQRIAASVPDIETANEPMKKLLRQVDEALIRIEVNQLSSRPAEDPAKQLWLLEFPLRTDDATADLIRIRIERDGSNADGSEHAWKVSIQLDLGSFGAVAITVTLREGLVSAQFAADHPETASLFHRHLHQLEKSLAGHGLKVGALSSRTHAKLSPGAGDSGSLDVLA